MGVRIRSTGVYLLLDGALLVACVLHLPTLTSRLRVPFSVDHDPSDAVVLQILHPGAAGDLRVGDRILSCDGVTVSRPEVLEFCSDLDLEAGRVNLEVFRDNNTFRLNVDLVPYYPPGTVVVFYVVGVLTWCLGVYIALKGPPGITKRVLHAAFLSMAVVVMMAWESTSAGSVLPRWLGSGLFFGSYLAVVVTFFHFTTLFPRRVDSGRFSVHGAFYVGGTVLVVLLLVAQFRAIDSRSTEEILAFWKLFDLFHWVVIVGIVAGIASFWRAWARAESVAEKRKLQWLLFGLIFGPGPFVAFTLVPPLVHPGSGVPETFTLGFLVVIPVAFAISFIKYHVLDIRLVLSRTTAYSILLGFLVLVYAGLVGGLSFVVGASGIPVSASAAVLVGLMFEPARRAVQRVVDRRFFRVRYDYRVAQARFSALLKNSADTRQVGELLVRETDVLIPVERLALFSLDRPAARLRCVSHKGFDILERRRIPFHEEQLKTRLHLPVALTDRLEDGIPHEQADETVFRRWGMALVFPMLSDRFVFLGFFVLGEKKSGGRFTVEDVDLLRSVSTQAGLEIERIVLQRELIRKEDEADRLKSLNEIKSDFVSYVSHEFLNPLTSIGMFVEYLRPRVTSRNRKVQNYLDVIEGEAGRLQRLVDTLLDAARIDSGVKQFTFSPIDLREVVRDALRSMRYQLGSAGLRLHFRPGRRSAKIVGDADAVELSVRNLVANAVKYAAEGKYLGVTIVRRSGDVECRVEDRGPGIPPELLPHLFEKFFRDPAQSAHVRGVGLGLPLVRRIMEAHGGSVNVTSTRGSGSVFTLKFPLDEHTVQRSGRTRGRRG